MIYDRLGIARHTLSPCLNLYTKNETQIIGLNSQTPLAAWQLPEFSLKFLLANRFQHFFYGDDIGVVCNIQQIRRFVCKFDCKNLAVIFIFDQLNTLKPFQGLFDPVGSVTSVQLEPVAHLPDVERHNLFTS